LKTAVQRAKLGQSEELAAIKRLDDQASRLERHASGPSVEARCSPMSGRTPINMAAEAYLAWSRRPMGPRGAWERARNDGQAYRPGGIRLVLVAFI
jgi:hypothetical protein